MIALGVVAVLAILGVGLLLNLLRGPQSSRLHTLALIVATALTLAVGNWLQSGLAMQLMGPPLMLLLVGFALWTMIRSFFR